MDFVPISPTTPLSPTTFITPELDSFTIPELNDTEFFTQVLLLSADKTETEADNELVARANAMGIVATLPSVASKRHLSSALSNSSFGTYQERSFSSASNGSFASTVLTPRSSIFGLPSPLVDGFDMGEEEDAKLVSFSQYERFLIAFDAAPDHHKFLSAPAAGDGSAQSVFSVSTQRSFSSVKTGLRSKMKWRKKAARPLDSSLSCATCRQDFEKAGRLHSLPCGHTHCAGCIKVMVNQAITHEARMPPRCCSQPVPTSTIRSILGPDAKDGFLLAVAKYSTPWDERVFCPDANCGEFVPPPDTPDAKHPFDLSCLKCHGRMCGMCKSIAHPVGQDCPQDWELVAMKKLDSDTLWKRCYKCRNVAQLGDAPSVRCRCKSEFCTVCGGIWDFTIGCPNLCNFEDEVERRRQEAEKRKLAPEATAEELLSANAAIKQLGEDQDSEMRRFIEYQAKANIALKKRHATQKSAIDEKYAMQEENMKERHDGAIVQLEDRQIAAELELRTSLEQSARSVRLRLKHMEAYCDGLGRNPTSEAPERKVTERDLRELGQQYNLRDDMNRMHQSKINVMRDRQAKAMEDLLDRQEKEMDKLGDKRQTELDKLDTICLEEESQLKEVFEARQSRMNPRWVLAIEVLCKELEEQTTEPFARIAPPKWPEQSESEPEPESDVVAEVEAEPRLELEQLDPIAELKPVQESIAVA